jgi:hypothetical protein
MSKKRDLNEIAKIEKAIKEKYGEEAIQNPKGSWDKEKEAKYLEQLKHFYENGARSKQTKQANGFIIKSKKTNKKTERQCPVCSKYSFSANDDVYMAKFQCCYDCYIQHVIDREERWKSGWRPNN